MNHIGEDGSESVIHPLLMECDRLGRVNWLSAEARLALGDADHLLSAIRTGSASGPGSEVGLSLVFETSDKVWISARLPNPRKSDLREETIGLRNLQDNLARQCFRLQNAERSLSTRTMQMRAGGGGRRAVLLVERERERLGRDLHTGVGQMLVAIRTQLEIIVTQLPAPPDMVREALNRISTLLGETLEQVRSVSRKLHPPEWLRLTLETALRQLWEISGIPERYQASLQLTVLPEEPDLEVKILMYRAAQEALSNLTQHSKATRIDMSLVVTGGQLVLTVRDNGVGFDTARQFAAPANVASGIGLRSIREQANSLGGGFAIESGLTGTTLQVWAPKSQEPS